MTVPLVCKLTHICSSAQAGSWFHMKLEGIVARALGRPGDTWSSRPEPRPLAGLCTVLWERRVTASSHGCPSPSLPLGKPCSMLRPSLTAQSVPLLLTSPRAPI